MPWRCGSCASCSAGYEQSGENWGRVFAPSFFALLPSDEKKPSKHFNFFGGVVSPPNANKCVLAPLFRFCEVVAVSCLSRNTKNGGGQSVGASATPRPCWRRLVGLSPAFRLGSLPVGRGGASLGRLSSLVVVALSSLGASVSAVALGSVPLRSVAVSLGFGSAPLWGLMLPPLSVSVGSLPWSLCRSSVRGCLSGWLCLFYVVVSPPLSLPSVAGFFGVALGSLSALCRGSSCVLYCVGIPPHIGRVSLSPVLGSVSSAPLALGRFSGVLGCTKTIFF